MNKQHEIESDEHLIEINEIAKNLKFNVSAINDSLKDQNRMAKEISGKMEISQNKMNFVTEKLGTILKTRDNKQLYTIIILWLVLMFQIFVLIFT